MRRLKLAGGVGGDFQVSLLASSSIFFLLKQGETNEKEGQTFPFLCVYFPLETHFQEM